MNQPFSLVAKRIKRYRLLGWLFVAGPPVGFVLDLLTWSIVSSVIRNMLASTPELSDGGNVVIFARIVNVGLGFFGILCILGFFVLIPLGAYFFSKASDLSYANQTPNPDQPPNPDSAQDGAPNP